MDTNEMKRFEHLVYAESEARAKQSCIELLERENNHLRQVIEMLITSKSPTI